MVRLQTPTRVLIADDEEIIRYGLKAIFQAEAMVDVVGEACNGREAIAQAKPCSLSRAHGHQHA